LLYHSQNYKIFLKIAFFGPIYETGTSQTRSGNDVLWSVNLYLNITCFRVKEMGKGHGEGKERKRIINGMKNCMKNGQKKHKCKKGIKKG
jgi:hypothetical protein